jgi:hypothetical protein
MKHYCRILTCLLAIRAGKEIAFRNVDSCGPGLTLNNGFELGQVTGGPNKASNVSKPTFQQIPYNPDSYKTRCSGDEDSVIRADD